MCVVSLPFVLWIAFLCLILCLGKVVGSVEDGCFVRLRFTCVRRSRSDRVSDGGAEKKRNKGEQETAQPDGGQLLAKKEGRASLSRVVLAVVRFATPVRVLFCGIASCLCV